MYKKSHGDLILYLASLTQQQVLRLSFCYVTDLFVSSVAE